MPTMKAKARNSREGIGGTSKAVARTTADASRCASLIVEVDIYVQKGMGAE
jgi:hypothetical protein